MGCFSNSGVAAITGAILGITLPVFAIVELFSAMSAGKGTAVVTDLRARGSRTEALTTKLADALGKLRVGIPTLANQFGALPPELAVSGSVTMNAKRDQIIQPVGFKVVVEKLVRTLMMNLKAQISSTAALASVTVTLKSFFALFIPIGATIVFMATTPSIAVLASKSSLAIFGVALGIAEHIFALLEAVGLHLKGLTAIAALSRDALAAHALAVLTLPQTVALLATKMMLELVLLVGLGLKLNTAMVAD